MAVAKRSVGPANYQSTAGYIIGTNIPLLGEFKVRFEIASKEQTVIAVVIKEVHEFILGIDFLTDEGCWWDFGDVRVQLCGDQVLLSRQVYICTSCCVLLRMQAVDISLQYTQTHDDR